MKRGVNEKMNIADEYWCKHFPAKDSGRKETDYGYKIRQTWRELGFPNYPVVDEYLSLPTNTTNQYASKYDYNSIKAKYEELKNQLYLEQQEKELQEMEEDYSDIWKTARGSIKYRINDLTTKIKKATNEKELEKLWDKYYEALNELKSIQPTERINKHLPNAYKDNSVDKFEVEQKGQLTLNQNIKNSESEEERLERYADYFKRINSKATSKDSNNSTK